MLLGRDLEHLYLRGHSGILVEAGLLLVVQMNQRCSCQHGHRSRVGGAMHLVLALKCILGLVYQRKVIYILTMMMMAMMMMEKGSKIKPLHLKENHF